MCDKRLLPSVVEYVTTLVDLISSTRTIDLELEQTRTQTLQTIAKDRQKATTEAAAHAAKVVEEANAFSTELLGTTRTEVDQTLQRLASEYDIRRNEILDESESIRTKAARNADETRWLADSMYEAALTDPERDVRNATAELTDADKRSGSLVKRIETLSPRLKPQTGTFPPGPELPDAGLIDTSLTKAKDILDGETTTVSTKANRWMARLVAFAVPSAAGIVLFMTETTSRNLGLGAGLGAGAVLTGVVVVLQMTRRRRRLQHARRLADRAANLANRRHEVLTKRLKKAERKAREQRETERSKARDQLADQMERAGPRTERRLKKLDALRAQRETEQQEKLDAASTEAVARVSNDTTSSEQEHRDTLKNVTRTAAELTKDIEHEYTCACTDLQLQWTQGQASLASLLEHIKQLDDGCGPTWNSGTWTTQSLPLAFAGDIRMAVASGRAQALGGELPARDELPWTGPEDLALPIALDLRDLGALRIEHDAESRLQAMATLRSMVLRTLTTIPPGRLRLVLCDPVGLGQEFAGFMHLADHEEADILTRIWTEPQHIEQRLTDLTEHMESVIQTYLRNEYESIEEYNAQAGEIAEPYRLLVLADFPEGLSERGVRRLESIVASGRRCGVFTMILRDTARDMPEGLSETALNEGALRLQCKDGGWSLLHPELPPMDISIEEPPNDDALTAIVERVGSAAAGSRRVEVSFDFVAPPKDERWTASTGKELRVPIGQSGATRRMEFRLGRGTTQHALIAGKTGSGKSTLLHVLITNLAMWCSPDEVEFYLVDFKKGVEFQAYATAKLPHARVVAIESDREFGLSVLRRLDSELRRRGELFRDLGVQDLAAFRERGDGIMPRILLIIDEFQEFFVDDDPVAQEASLLMDRLVRQGRAFGMHAILGSQTLDGAYSLARSTLGQMGVRIALQCSETDSYLILSDDNPAARLLGRPGEAIYNDAGGKIDGNTPFQVVWLDDGERDAMLADAAALDGGKQREQFVFRGHIPASLPDDRFIVNALAGDVEPLPDGGVLPIRLGEPVAIRESSELVLRPQAGGNAMLIGQHPEAATALLTGGLLQAALRLGPAASINEPGLQIWLIDGQPPDAMLAGRVAQFAAALPHVVHRVTARNLDEEMAALGDVLASRSDGLREGRATILVIGIDLHRLRDLRVREDDFSFSVDEDTSASRPDTVLAEILREGPSVGIHSMLWFDGTANLTRTLDRNSQREFEQKVLFQMSANDSGQLIDSTVASDLGLHRGLLYVEDTGTLEKFRPWSLPDQAWLQRMAEHLQQHARIS